MTLDFSSLRTRFIAATILSIIIGTLLTGIIVARVIQSYVLDGFHEEMEVHIQELGVLSNVDAQGQPYLLRRLSDPRFIPSGSGFYWQVERTGFATVRSPSLGNKTLPAGLAQGTQPRWRFVKGPTGDALQYAMMKPVADGGPPLILTISTDQRLIDEVLAQIDWPLLYSLASFACVMILIGIVQINYSMRPLLKMKGSIEAIRAGRERHMVGDYPSEVKPLVADLNQLLDANWEMVQSARVQAGNLAHGLRTPLAIIADEAQSVEKMGGSSSAAVLLDSCRQMQRYIEYYTSRARMAAHANLPGHRAALDKVLEPVVNAMRRLHRDRALTLAVAYGPRIDVSIDEVDLSEILSNLIDNACKWATSRVEIGWHLDDGAAVLQIADDGPGIPGAYRDAVFNVGERLDRAEVGTGLGLAIVKDLVLHYRGSIELEDSPLGGLGIRLRIPFRP